jgi:hypothetical protein
MTMPGSLSARRWIFWGLVVALLLGATTAIALSRATPQSVTPRPAHVAPPEPLTLTNVRAA